MGGGFLNKRQVLSFFPSIGPIPTFVRSSTSAHGGCLNMYCSTLFRVCGPGCIPSRALQPTAEDPSGDLGTRGARDLLGKCRPKLGLGPPKPRMETTPDIFPRQSWWAGYPSPGLTFRAGFSGIPKHRGQRGCRWHFG